jgi:Dolichyl-phosphate-mannose-protein mannosyltransferase
MNELVDTRAAAPVLSPRTLLRTISSPLGLGAIAALFAVTAILQIATASRQCLWGDEIFSVATATGHSLEHPAATARPNLGDFVEPDHAVPAEEFRRFLKHDTPVETPGRVVRAVMRSDTSPPLYYLLLYGWTLIFGTSDITVRLFSVACSLGCLPLLVGVARRTGGSGAVVPACVLFAFSPLCIYYSTEVRMYSLLLLCELGVAWLSLVLNQRGGGPAVQLLWVVASAAGFLTHYFFVFPWLAMVAFLLVRPGKFQRSHLLACVFLTGLAILPWYLVVPETFNQWRITQGWLKMRPKEFHRWRATRNHFLQFFSTSGYGLWTTYRVCTLSVLALFVLVAAAMLFRLRWRLFSAPLMFLLLWFVAACAAPSIMDLVQHTYAANSPRYALAGLPAAYLLAALGFQCFSHWTRRALLILVVLAWSPAIADIYLQRTRSKEPYRQVARALSRDSSSSDLVLVHSIPSGVLGIARYYDGPAGIAAWIGQLKQRRVPESLQQLAAGRKRIFFIKVHDVGEPAPEEDWLGMNAILFQETNVEEATVVEFRPSAAETF